MMKRKQKLWIGGGVLAAVLITILALYSGGTEVETVTVRRGDIVRTVEDTGYVRAVISRDLYADQSARVVALPVDTGQAVKQGQTLAVLDNPELAVQIDETTSQLAQAESGIEAAGASLERAKMEAADAQDNLQRVEQLYQIGAASKTDYEKARLQANSAQQALTEQESALVGKQSEVKGLRQVLGQLSGKAEQLEVKSPMAGVVLNLPVKLAQYLNPGELILTVGVPGNLEVKADILSDDLAEVRVGQKVSITAPVLSQQVLYGKVKQIYPLAEEKESALGVVQRRVPVIISLDDPSILKPGYEVRVAIATAERQQVMLVPRQAVRTLENGKQQVMLVQDNHVKYRIVTAGIHDNDNVEVVQGLKEDDMIVRDGAVNLTDNARVKPRIGK
jgi:HlyD family secretion protein